MMMMILDFVVSKSSRLQPRLAPRRRRGLFVCKNREHAHSTMASKPEIYIKSSIQWNGIDF